MTSGVLSGLTKDIKRTITRIPVKPRKNSGNMSFDLASLLKNLKTINLFGKDFDYLNMSGSFPLEYALFGLKKNGEELAGKEVKKEVLMQIEHLSVPEVPQIISELSRIIENGTQVFISSCNKPLAFNPFGLAKGIHTIGGKNGKTGEPIQRFSHNALVDEYVNLPVYVTDSKAIMKETDKTAVNLNGIIETDSAISKIPRRDLKFATESEYKILENVANDLYSRKKFVFDLDFLRFKLISAVAKYNEQSSKMVNKVFETNKFLDIFKSKFDDEVLKYTNPTGSTHCDLMFRQFFNMKNKNNHVMPMKDTTLVPNTLSGTSFAAPQGLNNAIRRNLGI